MTITELKAAVYDRIAVKEQAQLEIQQLNQEIGRLESEQEKEPASESEPVKVEEAPVETKE